MYKTVESLEEFNTIIKENMGVMMYFSNDTCNVCKVLKPQIAGMLADKFPKVPFYYVDMAITPEISAQASVFTVPTIVVYFDEKETIRKSRNLGMMELEQAIERPYKMIFE